MTRSNKRKRIPKLKMIRLEKGVTKAELARVSGLSVPTITDAEEASRATSEVTKHRIVNGLNKLSEGRRNLTVNEVFGDI